MLLKHIGLLTLINLSALSFGAAATAEFSNNGYEEIIQKTMESTDLRALHSKERTLGFLRGLEASETCVTETNAILEDVTIAAYIESLETDLYHYSFDFDVCDVDDNESDESFTVEVCDVESSLTPGFQGLCENAGGQYFTMTMISSDEEEKIIFRDIGSCGGASCDADELINQANVRLGPIKWEYESEGNSIEIISGSVEITSGSELKSAYFALGAAVISSFAFFLV